MKSAKQRFAGRYRAPGPKRSPLITPEGAAALKAELDDLWRNKRPVITQAVGEAAALGDRSENAEYIYGKKKLRELDYRIRYLDRLLNKAQIIEIDRNDCVYFGRYFEVVDEEGRKKRWIIVGEGETDFYEGAVSWKSVVGRALLGRSLGDVVFVKRPAGETELEVTKLD